MAIEALKQQPCEDGISREAMLLLQVKYAEDMSATKFWQMRDDIRSLPSITPKEKTGYWIKTTDKSGYLVWECDKCGWQQRFNTIFCPDCGARMLEPQESEG